MVLNIVIIVRYDIVMLENLFSMRLEPGFETQPDIRFLSTKPV